MLKWVEVKAVQILFISDFRNINMLLSKISTETEKESNYCIILVSCFFYASKFSVLPFLLILLIFFIFFFPL